MSAGKTSRLVVRTPEGIVFSLPLAGPVTRFLAWGIDFSATAVIMIVLVYFVVTARAMSGVLVFIGDWLEAAFLISVFAVNVGYNIAFEWFWRGQTLGKWALRLRVVDEHGLRLQFSQIVIRNLLRAIDSIPVLYVVGGLACFISRRAQRLGDYAANTVVIRTPKIQEPDLDKVLVGKYNSFRDYPHVEARLRQHVSPDIARIALQSLLRRDELDPRARVEVFGAVAAHLRTLAAFPEEATFALTDEHYVGNAVDSIFRAQRVANAVPARYNGVVARR
jgi:uncharacterized RDD family membrane protein YckC